MQIAIANGGRYLARNEISLETNNPYGFKCMGAYATKVSKFQPRSTYECKTAHNHTSTSTSTGTMYMGLEVRSFRVLNSGVLFRQFADDQKCLHRYPNPHPHAVHVSYICR
jgi:hypothetical protein